MDKNYNVDDILSEIKTRKSREKSASPPAREETGAPAPKAEPDCLDSFFSAEDDARAFHFGAAPEPRKRKHNPMEFTGHIRSITDKTKLRPGKQPFPVQPESAGEESAEQEPEPPRSAQEHSVNDLGNTQPIDNVVDFNAFRASASQTSDRTSVLPKAVPGAEQENAPPAGARKASRIAAAYTQGAYDDDEYRDDNFSHSAVDFGEYNSVEDRRDVATDIARVKLWLLIRGTVTLILAGMLLYLAFAGKYIMPLPKALDPVPETMRGYLIAGVALSGLLALINSSSVGGGLISLFKMRANSDTLATLAILAAIAQGVMGIVKPENVDPTKMNLYYPIAAVAMLFGVMGKMTMINRIQTNFRLLSSDKEKKALLRVEDEHFCREFFPDILRKPTIAYAARSDFFTDFLGLSYSDKYDVGIHRAVAPACLLGSIVVGAVTYLLTKNMQMAVSGLTAVLCIAATLSATFVENIPLGKLTKKLAPLGAMVSGNKAVEDFCDTTALILTERDLFPEGNVRLRGIKTFSQGRIDESIIDAASVICSLDSALSPVFLQMIGANRALLKKADNILYENGMGVSAWVDSRRVLIGNRLLMQNHGIAMPPKADKTAQTRAPEDGEMIYLSSSGEVTAQFAISYHIDEELAVQLDLLAAQERSLIIHANDANITPHRIWELYGYPEDLIFIVPSERYQQYREMTEKRESAIAEIVYTGRASSLAGAIVACTNARSSILCATTVQLIQIVIGYALAAFMAFFGAVASLSIVQMLIYQFFWFAVIFVLQKVKQP